MRGVEVIAAVKKCKKGDGKTGKPWCLYTKDGGRLLGAHKSKEDAYKQEAAIHAAMSEAGRKRAPWMPSKEEERKRERERKAKTRYGLFQWNKEGVYEPGDAIKLYKSEKVADKAAQKSFDNPKTRALNIVVRDVTIEPLASSVVATLDAVAQELDDRDDEDLAIEVDRVAESIKPADALEDKIEDELNRAGFTKDVLTRIDEVADKIYRERIPHIDYIPYNQSR